MKKIRCPHCGEQGISAFYKNTQAKMYFCSFEDMLKNDKGEKCTCCNKPYVIRPRYSFAIFWLFSILGIVVPFAELPILVSIDVWLTLLWTPLAVVTAYFFIFLSHLLCAPVAADNHTFKKMNRMSNVSIQLTEISKPIHNFDIYGIKFDKNIFNARFEEAFTRGIVPVMFFRKKRKQTTPVEAFIIKMEFVPDDFLFVGSTFSILDDSNNVIGRGKLHKIYS